MSSNRRDFYKITPIILSIVVICLSSYNVILNLPNPKLEVGEYPNEGYEMWSNTVRTVVVSPNETAPPESSLPPFESAPPYDIFNVTYQVLNSGKATANNVRLVLRQSLQAIVQSSPLMFMLIVHYLRIFYKL
ncbi:MAG: hypothetical protein ABSF44_08655 [Candidatus Bathyarchaeia archaeon]|jgi:hypothetical protein